MEKRKKKTRQGETASLRRRQTGNKISRQEGKKKNNFRSAQISCIRSISKPKLLPLTHTLGPSQINSIFEYGHNIFYLLGFFLEKAALLGTKRAILHCIGPALNKSGLHIWYNSFIQKSNGCKAFHVLPIFSLLLWETVVSPAKKNFVFESPMQSV